MPMINTLSFVLRLSGLSAFVSVSMSVSMSVSLARAGGPSAKGLAIYRERAAKFFCQKGFCETREVSVRGASDIEHLGFHDQVANEILIRPDQDSVEMQLTLVHELTHVIRKQWQRHDELWLEEVIAKFFEYQCSRVWPVSYQSRLARERYIRFSNEKRDYQLNGIGYPSSFWFFVYLYNHFGGDRFVSKVLTSPKTGWDNVIDAIEALRREGLLGIDPKLISKESILRHFALSMWLNNSYYANYGLFRLDDRFESLAESEARTARDQTVRSRADMLQVGTYTVPDWDSVEIRFTHTFPKQTARETWAIVSRDPFTVKKGDPGDWAEVFIQIDY